MHADALAPYELSLSTGSPLQLHYGDGRTITLDVPRWLGNADSVDLEVVAHTVGPVLDVGCGPGRIVAALTDHGRLALGIDIAERAVALTRARGLNVLRRDVFGSVPGAGRWNSVVLLDGNIGIGGDVDALLARVRDLLAPGGLILVETHPDDNADESAAVRFAIADEPLGPPFPWCFVGMQALCRAARRCALVVVDEWSSGGRRFAVLTASRSS